MVYDPPMRGRKRKPIERQIADGDTRKRGRLKLAEQLASIPKTARGLPDCPRHLRGRARAAWNLLRSELEAMELDATADAMLLEALCTNYETAVRAHLKIAQQGEVLEESIVARDSGKVLGHRFRKNPWVTVRADAHRLMLAFASEFGVSPASRSRLNVTTPAHETEADVEAVLYGPTLTDEEKQKMQ
jgi:P27 family predicted phage terminase small subunit